MSIDRQDERSYNAGRWARTIAGQVFMLGLLLVTLYPLIFMFFMSLKESSDIFSNPWLPPLQPEWQNYVEAWRIGRVAQYFRNSAIVAGMSVILMTGISVLSGYALGRIRFRGDKLVFLIIIGTMTLPIETILIPIFIMVKNLGWLNTYLGLIVPYTAFGIALGTFVLQGFFASIPVELEHAARIDGASEFGIFWRIMLPLAWPSVGTMIIFNFIWVWSEFLWAVISTTSNDVKTLPIGLLGFQDRWLTNWGPLMAGLTIVVIPMLVIYFLFQRQFVKGLTAGALK